MGEKGIFLMKRVPGQPVFVPPGIPWKETELCRKKEREIEKKKKTHEPYGILYFFPSYHLV